MVAGVRGGCPGSGGGGLDGLPGSCASTSMDGWPWLGSAGLGGAGWLLGCETGLGALWWCLGDLWMETGGACGARSGLVDVWVMHGMVMDETLHVFPGGGVGEIAPRVLAGGVCGVPFGPLLCGLLLAGGVLLPPWGFPCVR